MKSSLKFALVVVSFAFLTACGGASTETTTTDSTAVAPTETAAPVETPVATDSTAVSDTTKKAQ